MPDTKTSLGLTAKKENLSEWFQQIVIKAELADYGPVSGCMILRPLSYGMWERIRTFFDKLIQKTGHSNVYFPLLIPEGLFKKEAQHVKGFTAEVAWVTQAGNSALHERLAIRPTSETIMYDTYSKWIRSWRDLPLLLNQWCNVVRWEFENPKPFLRTREFLWQEGHTVHENKEQTDKEVMMILGFYKKVMEELLAVPVLDGKKSESEKFAGALYTTTLEAMMPDGKALQMATSHNLGTNFAKVFNINYLGKDGNTHKAWQTSWGMSTRSIGAVILLHGDDKGLVVPPELAPTQIVIVPIFRDKTKENVLIEAKKLYDNLSVKFRVHLDDRDGYTPGWKFNEWELKGIPMRIELGPRDIEKKEAVMVSRDSNEKIAVPLSKLTKEVRKELHALQKRLFQKAKESLKEITVNVSTWKAFEESINEKKLVRCFHCGQPDCEASVKEESMATNRLIPFHQPKLEGKKCVKCGLAAQYHAYFARNY